MQTTYLARAPSERPADLFFKIAIAVVVAVKAYTLIVFWNDRLGDYGRLVAFAESILSSSSWLYDAGIDRESLPPELWKTPGYPLMIVATKLLLGDQWWHAFMVLSSVASFVAGLYVRRLALAFKFGPALAAIAFVMFEFSVPASTDVLIMPDGLYGSLATIILCVIGTQFLTTGDVSTRTMIGAGLIIAFCFFIREGFLYLIIPIALALVVPVWWNGATLRHAAVLLLAICLPTFVCAAAVMSWNRYRTGEFMVAAVSQTVFMTAAMKAAEKDHGVFDGDAPIDKIARDTFSDYDYGDAQAVINGLFERYGYKAPEIDRIVRAKFWQIVLEHPKPFFLSMLDRFRFGQQASMVGDLLMRLDDLEYWRFVVYRHDYYGGWRATAMKLRETRDLSLLTPDLLMKIVSRAATRAVSTALFLLFVVGLPLYAFFALRTSGDPFERRRAIYFLALYILYWAAFSAYLLVNVEIRYLGPICSIPIFGSLFVLLRLSRFWPERFSFARPNA